MISYKDLENLDKNKEYRWKVFQIIGDVYIRFTYNEDLNGFISVDLMQNGLLQENVLIPLKYRFGNTLSLGELYPLTQENYTKALNTIASVKKYIVSNIKNETWDDNNIWGDD